MFPKVQCLQCLQCPREGWRAWGFQKRMAGVNLQKRTIAFLLNYDGWICRNWKCHLRHWNTAGKVRNLATSLRFWHMYPRTVARRFAYAIPPHMFYFNPNTCLILVPKLYPSKILSKNMLLILVPKLCLSRIVFKNMF